MEIYGKVSKPYWDDRPVAIVGGGHSLQDFDFEHLRGAHVLAVKNAIPNIPWADAGFGLGDYGEWRERLANVQARIYWAVRDGEAVPSPSKNTTLLKRFDGRGLSDDPGVIYSGGTSGFGALQICIHKRAKQIVLFGYDYESASPVSDARGSKRRDQDAAHWRVWAEYFSVYSPYFTQHGVSVANACPTSAIRCFQKVTLWDGVAMLQAKKRSAG